MSRFVDVTGTVETGQKGQAPKEETACRSSLGHRIKNSMTVIFLRWGAID